jgi:hypothetical protein
MHVIGTTLGDEVLDRLGLIPFAASFGSRAPNRSQGSVAIAMCRDALQTQTFRAKRKPPGREHGSVHGVADYA